MQGGGASPGVKKDLTGLKYVSVIGHACDGKPAACQELLRLFHAADDAVLAGAETHCAALRADAQHFHGQVRAGTVVGQKAVNP